MEDRSQLPRLSVLMGKGRAVSTIKWLSQVETKAVWLRLEGHNWWIYSLFHLCLGQDNYSCIFLYCYASLYTSGKLQRVPLKNNLLLPPTSITNYHTKVSQHMMLHYTESLHRLSAAGWLKSSSPEFPQLASVIKVDEGRRLARWAQKWSFAWGSLCSVYGERLPYLVCFTLQNMHCL